MIDESAIRLRYEALKPVLDEQGRRRFAAAEARAAGHGGVSLVARVTGIARSTIGRGLTELREAVVPTPGRVRRRGGGRKPLTATDPSLLEDLRRLVEPTTRGDPERPLLWTAKSLRNLTAGLYALGHRVGHNTVGTLLRTLGYSLQANRKTREGTSHPDRDAQFGYINEQVKAALRTRCGAKLNTLPTFLTSCCLMTRCAWRSTFCKPRRPTSTQHFLRIATGQCWFRC